MNQDNRCKTPEPTNESIPFKPGENLPYTHEPKKVHIIIPDTPKKSSSKFICRGCGDINNNLGTTDSEGNKYCMNCY